MPTYHELLEILIEEPELIGPKAARVGFISSSKPQYIDPGDGTPPVPFGPGMIRVSVPGRATDLYSGASSIIGSASATLSLDRFDAVTMNAKSLRFQHMRARFYWWTEGQTLEEAELLWDGLVRSPVIDVDGRTFSFSAAAGTREVNVEFPPGLIGDEGRFPATIPDASKPIPMPVVYGTVRKLPIYAVQDDTVGFGFVRYIMAGHKIPHVRYIVRGDNGTLQGLTFNGFDVDDLGREYSFIEVSTAAAGWAAGSALYIDGEVAGYSAPGDAVGAVADDPRWIKGLGDMLIHAVETYGRELFFALDRPRIYAARSHLNRFKIGMWFNAQQMGSSFLQILKSRIEAQFPVTFSYVGGRFGWDYTAVPDQGLTMGHIVWRQNAHVRTPLTMVSIDLLRSEFAVHYGGDGHAAGAVVPITRGPDTSQKARRARTRWGISRKQTIQAPDATDDFSAALLLEDQIIRLTLRRSRISYTVDEPEWLGMPLLGRVLVTDPDLQWVEQACLIEGLTPAEGGAGRVVVNLITEDGI